MKSIARVLLLTFMPLEAVWAVDKSFTKVLQHIEFDSSEGHSQWLEPVVFGVMVVVLVLCLALYFFHRSDDRRKGKLPLEISAKKRRQNFIAQAQRLGFTHAEARMLSQIAGDSEAEHFERLLKKGPHFRRLAAQVDRQTRQRKRELEVLDEIVAKITRIKRQNVQERKDLRIDMDLPVWLGSENNGQVEGQLVNLSMGGAAIRADMDLGKGDQVEVWSVDTRWLPPITAVVLRAEGEGDKCRFNLQFAKTPSGELRAAILELQKSARGMVGPIREQAA